MAELTVTLAVERLRTLRSTDGAVLADEIEWLEVELRRILLFLRDEDSRKEREEEVRRWVEEITEAALQAEDVVDAFIQRYGSSKRRTGLKNSIRRYVSIPRGLQARRATAGEIKGVKERIRDVSECRPACVIESPEADEKRPDERRRENYDGGDEIVGFVKEVGKLEKLLLGVDRRRVTVSIVGAAGSGRTTLAEKIYDSARSGGRFGCCVWITVPLGRDARGILEEMARKAMGMDEREIELAFAGDLEGKLREFLTRGRYLVVLDDLRTEIWDRLNPVLPNANNGSRLLITTASVGVAMSALPCFPPHHLQALGEEESWELLARMAFASRGEMKEACTREMAKVGRQIARRCGGLPLALVVTGGSLFAKSRSLDSWQRASEGFGWQANPCLEALDLSFRDLPCGLRCCFLYLSAFPAHREIDAEKLVRLWIAEGLVEGTRGESLEDTGERYLSELIRRRFVRVSAATNARGQTWTCGVHELVLGYSTSKSKEANFFHVYAGVESSPSPHTAMSILRRVAVHSHAAISTLDTARSLRSLLDFSGHPWGPELGKWKLMRVLDLEGSPMQALPKEIGDMIHLRYLGLRGTEVKKLPSSACDLYNLQTLDLRNTGVSLLPDGVWKIEALRHVCGRWLQAPENIGGSSRNHLQTLEAVEAGPWIENSLCRLSNLRKLSVFRFEAGRPYAGALSVTLAKLQHLNSLSVSAGDGPLPVELLSTISGHCKIRVLSLRGSLARCLEFQGLPPNLVELTLKSTKLAASFWAAVASLRRLEVLVLEKGSYVGTEMGCVAGSFPALRELWLKQLERLEAWRVEKKAMPSLVHVSIDGCRAMVELPSGLRHLRSLRRLELKGMSPLFCDNVRRKNWRDVQHVPSVSMDGAVW